MNRSLSSILFAGGLALAASTHFVLQTVLMNRLDDWWLAAVETLVAAVAVIVLSGLPRPGGLRASGVRHLAAAAGLGIVGLWLPQALVLANRLTDAPSGSESLFFTTAAWSLPVLLVASTNRARRPSALQVCGVLLGLLGAAAVLANWERPSSFSPFVKFPIAEAYMLLAGFAWAASVALLSRGFAGRDYRTLLPVAAVAASLAGVVAAFVAGGPVPAQQIATNFPAVILVGAALGVAWWTWAQLARRGEEARGAIPLVVPPVIVTALSLVERLGTIYGPPPVQFVPAIGGAVLVLVACVLAWSDGTRATRPDDRRRALLLGLVALGALVFGLVALAWPRLAASVTGEVNNEAFVAQWDLLGAETVGGWLAVLLPLTLLARMLAPARRRTLVLWAAAALVLVAAYLATGHTHLRTWTRWIPPEVQQDYGTEYASLHIVPLVSWPERGAIALATLGFVALAVFPPRRPELSGELDA